jgi:hypothetical protein
MTSFPTSRPIARTSLMRAKTTSGEAIDQHWRFRVRLRSTTKPRPPVPTFATALAKSFAIGLLRRRVGKKGRPEPLPRCHSSQANVVAHDRASDCLKPARTAICQSTFSLLGTRARSSSSGAKAAMARMPIASTIGRWDCKDRVGYPGNLVQTIVPFFVGYTATVLRCPRFEYPPVFLD